MTYDTPQLNNDQKLSYRGPLYYEHLTNDDRLVLMDDEGGIAHMFLVVMVEPACIMIRDLADDRMILFDWDDFHQYSFIKLEGDYNA